MVPGAKNQTENKSILWPKREIDGFLSSGYAKTPSGERDRQAPRLLITILFTSMHDYSLVESIVCECLFHSYRSINSGSYYLYISPLLGLACFPIPYTVEVPATRPTLPPRATHLFCSY